MAHRRPSDRPTKVCATCGRDFAWRKRWARVWDEVRYCSDRCRRSSKRAVDTELEQAILALLAERAQDASICPSEAARRVRPDDWRTLMDSARNAARRLTARGELEITQKGRVVDASTARGPIRLRRPR